jgi:peptidoglycan biosynthesis protein MviN/MurJ (putative lipid II flippase)
VSVPNPVPVEAETTARGSLTVSAWTLVSRFTGMLRVLVIGALLGATYLANVFQAGYLLPNTVFALVAGPVLGMAVVPAVARGVVSGGTDRAAEVLGRIAGRLLSLAAVGTLVMAVLAPGLAWSLVFAVPEPYRMRAWLMCTVLVLFVAPQVLLYTVVELGVAAQQGRHRFALAAGAPAVESLGTILTLTISAWIFGVGVDIGHAPLSMMVLLGAGTTGSVVVHAVLQCYGAARAGVPIRPRCGWRTDADAAATLRRMVRSIPVAGGPAVVDYGLTVIAATVPGGVLVVQVSYQVYAALAFVGSRAVSMAALPWLAEAVTAADPRRFAVAWRQGIFYALAAGVPLLLLLLVFAGPTANLLANGTIQNSPLVPALAHCLMVAAVAQLANGVHDYSRQALFARLDDRGPSRASLVGVAASVVVTAATLALPAGGPRLVGLVVALLAGELASATYALARVRRAVRPERMIDWRHLVTLASASVVMLPVLGAGWWVERAVEVSRPVELALLVGLGVAALAPYAGVLMRGRGQWRAG